MIESARLRYHNLCMMPCAYNPRLVCCSASKSAGGRRRCCCRHGERRSRGRRRRGGFRRLWLRSHLPDRFGWRWRRRNRLKCRDHGIRIDGCSIPAPEAAGDRGDPNRNGDGQELVQGVRDRKTGWRIGQGDRARCSATRPERDTGVRSLRHRVKLELHQQGRHFHGVKGR